MKPLKKRQMRKPLSGWKEDQIPQMIVARANEPVNSDVSELQTNFLIVTVEDTSRLRSLDLTLLYKFGHGSFGVSMHHYEKAVEVLRSPDITLLCRNSSETSLIASRDLLMFILTLNSRTLPQAKLALAQAMTPATLRRIATFYLETSPNKELYIVLNLTNSIAMRPNPEPVLTKSNSKTIKCRTFAALIASMNRRWPKWRLVFTSHGFALSTASLGSDNNSDVCVLGKQVLLSQPESHTSGLSDSKHLVKEWSFKVKVDHLLRFICQVLPTSSELDMELSRKFSPGEYIALLLHASFGELKLIVAAQHASRDTCCIMEHKLGKLNYDESVFGTFESGSELLVRGSRIDITTKFRYDGGLDNWRSSRRSTDDGEMVSCDICESWQHTRSTLIEDTEAVASLFMCPRCSW